MDLPELRPFPQYPQILGTPETPLEFGYIHVIRLHYGSWVQAPKKPGELAIEVRLRSDSALQAELAASLARTDIGFINVFQLDVGVWKPWGPRRTNPVSALQAWNNIFSPRVAGPAD